jgi:chaperone modulatory protein CbpM
MAEDLLIPDDNDSPVRLEELLSASGLAQEEVIELVQFGVFQVADGSETTWTFHTRTLTLARRAARLRDDFGLNVSGMALALTYLDRIEALEHRLRELESQLPR